MSVIEIRERDINFFCKEIVNKVLGEYKQNINFLLTGALGTGKSLTAIEIAVVCSELIAERLGGKPEDYFNINENLGCMNMEEIIPVHEKMSKTKHGIFIIDDASPVINSRKSFDKGNLAQNDMLITQRPNENICIYTLPQKFLMDKVPRSLSGYIGYMKPAKYFKYGFSCVDIRKIDFVPSKAEPNYPYLQNTSGEKVKLHFYRKPDQALVDIYDARRRKAQDALAAKSIEVLLQKPEEKIPKIKKGDLYRQIHAEFMKGDFGDISLKEVCRMKKVPYQSLLNAVGQ